MEVKYYKMSNSKTISVDKKLMLEVENFFEKFAESNDISSSVAHKIMIISDEIFSNIAYYSMASDVVLNANLEGNNVIITFKDNGIPYNPLQKDDPDVSMPLEDRAAGGLGIYIVKNMSKDIKYTRDGEYNILEIVLEN